MILPSYLIQLGYESIPIVKELNSRSFDEKDEHIDLVRPWSDLRNVFEYLSCVEYARRQILELPKGKAIGSVDIIPARYHSASLVFFCQAALDNLAVWLNSSHRCGLKGTNVSFYKNEIKKSLSDIDKDYVALLDKHNKFIHRLNSYRMEWLHRLAGGAELYSDKNPADLEANISIQIPIDPQIPSLRGDPKEYLNRIRKVQRENKGRWLVPIEHFANEIAEETKNLILGLLEISSTVIKKA